MVTVTKKDIGGRSIQQFNKENPENKLTGNQYYAAATTGSTITKSSTPINVNIQKNASFWDKVSSNEIKASGYNSLNDWKNAYEAGNAPAPPSAVGSSFKFDSKGRLVDTVTGAIKPNVDSSAKFYGIKNKTERYDKLASFANEGGGKSFGELNSDDKAYLKERGYEARASFYDPTLNKGGEVYERINQGSLSTAPEIVQAGALVAQQIAETPENVYLSKGSEIVPEITFKKIGENKYAEIGRDVSSTKTLTYDEVLARQAEWESGAYETAKSNLNMNAIDFAILASTFGRGNSFTLGAKTAFVKLGSKEAIELGVGSVTKQGVKQLIKQEAKTNASSIAKQFAKTFGKKTLQLAGTRPGRIITGLGIAATGNVIGQASPETFTQGSLFVERTTGALNLANTEDEQKKLDLAISKTYEKTKNRFEGYIEESQDATGKSTLTTKKGEGDDISKIATTLVPGARLFTKYKDIWEEELIPALKEQGFTDAQIKKNKDAIIRSYLNARQTGATFGNIAVEIGGELGFRRLATGALKTPKISGIRSGIVYGGKLGLLSTPFGGMEGYSQDIIESSATFRKRDAGREIQSAVFGAGISSAFNFSTGVSMGAGKRISQIVGQKKTPSAFKKGAELGAKTVTTIGYLADAPGEFIGDKSADIIENITKVTRKNVVNVPKGKVSTIGFGSSLNTVQKGTSKQQTKSPKVQTSNLLQGLFGFGASSKNPNTKGGGTNQNILGTDTKGETTNDTKGKGENNNILDLGDNTSTSSQNETEQNTKQDTTVSNQAEATDTVNVNVMSPVGRVGGFPFLPFGGTGQGTKRTRGTIRNELAEALSSIGVRTKQEVTVGKDYLKKINRLRR